MMQATINDLQIHTQQLLETVSRGEEIVIIHEGKSWVKIVPFISPEMPLGKCTNPLRGIWKDHEPSRDVSAYVENLRKGRL
ncbi:type II toxin-antitoxin system prevent-host-death family antitoxin [Deltaproteobacteria bacterium TL4]